jgi:hypothetical protein
LEGFLVTGAFEGALVIGAFEGFLVGLKYEEGTVDGFAEGTTLGATEMGDGMQPH